MFDLRCETCDRTYLVGSRRLLEIQNTSEGPVGRALCPLGHANPVDFRGRRARRLAPERLAPAHAKMVGHERPEHQSVTSQLA